MPVPQLRNAKKQRFLSSSTAVARNAKVRMVLHVNQKEFQSVKKRARFKPATKNISPKGHTNFNPKNIARTVVIHL